MVVWLTWIINIKFMFLLHVDWSFCSLQEREDGPHKPGVHRGNPGEDQEVPPGVSMTYGYPEKSNPFVQLRLPVPMTYEGKKSRCVSFMDSSGASFRGTQRSRAQAIQCVVAWSWDWWNQLSDLEKSAVRSSMANKRPHKEGDNLEGASKKPRSGWHVARIGWKQTKVNKHLTY